MTADGMDSGKLMLLRVKGYGDEPGRFALIDAADDWALQHRWHMSNPRSGSYPKRSVCSEADRGTSEMLHRQILGLRLGDPRVGDHRNGDHLDARRCNLRALTPGGNSQNVQRRSRSGIRGVDYIKGKYQARVRVNGKQVYLGTHSTPGEAAQAAADYRATVFPYAVEDRRAAEHCISLACSPAMRLAASQKLPEPASKPAEIQQNRPKVETAPNACAIEGEGAKICESQFAGLRHTPVPCFSAKLGGGVMPEASGFSDPSKSAPQRHRQTRLFDECEPSERSRNERGNSRTLR